MRSDLRVSQLRRIFITHLHGDHLFGLSGLLATCGLAGDAHGIDIYGPAGLDEYLHIVLRLSGTYLPFPLEVHEVEEGIVFEDGEFIVTALPLEHRIATFGYRVTEKERPGRFDAERAAALGVPAGPLYRRLKRGERITLSDGRVVDGAELCGPPQKGRVFAYCSDTCYCSNAVDLARDADLLVHEATFSHDEPELAHRSMHSTTTMAARVAFEAGVRQLAITHISSRYAPGSEVGPGELLEEARSIFPETVLAEDFMSIEIPRREDAGR
jgi:ribonuclease Z